jgi:hypothetical protein
MKKLFSVPVFEAFALAVSSGGIKGKHVAMKGWLGDSRCGSKRGLEHKACAKNCVKMGEKVTLIDDESGKIYKVRNQAVVRSLAGEHVLIEGAILTDGSLQVDKVAATK